MPTMNPTIVISFFWLLLGWPVHALGATVWIDSLFVYFDPEPWESPRVEICLGLGDSIEQATLVAQSVCIGIPGKMVRTEDYGTYSVREILTSCVGASWYAKASGRTRHDVLSGGVSCGSSNRAEAERTALVKCREGGGLNCKIVDSGYDDNSPAMDIEKLLRACGRCDKFCRNPGPCPPEQ